MCAGAAGRRHREIGGPRGGRDDDDRASASARSAVAARAAVGADGRGAGRDDRARRDDDHAATAAAGAVGGVRGAARAAVDAVAVQCAAGEGLCGAGQDRVAAFGRGGSRDTAARRAAGGAADASERVRLLRAQARGEAAARCARAGTAERARGQRCSIGAAGGRIAVAVDARAGAHGQRAGDEHPEPVRVQVDGGREREVVEVHVARECLVAVDGQVVVGAGAEEPVESEAGRSGGAVLAGFALRARRAGVALGARSARETALTLRSPRARSAGRALWARFAADGALHRRDLPRREVAAPQRPVLDLRGRHRVVAQLRRADAVAWQRRGVGTAAEGDEQRQKRDHVGE